MNRSVLAAFAYTALLASTTNAAAPEVRETPATVKALSQEDISKLPDARSVEALLRSCPPRTIPTFTPRTDPGTATTQPQAGCLQPDDLRMIEIYRSHQTARAEYGVRPLLWDPSLARAAQVYAENLAITGRLAHAPREGRGITRENLSQGLLGWGPLEMTNNWTKEKALFRPGTYPDVSTTGRWEDVSHFTQMIWPDTSTVGCGLADGSGSRWLVCRYSPGGNKEGKLVGQFIGDGPKTTAPAPADIAPANSGGAAVPPPPPPTARDDAPNGDETKHPLVTFAGGAMDAFMDAWRHGDRTAQARALDKLRYALDELRKRLKAARKAGPYSTVDPAKVDLQVKDMERMLNRAEDRFSGRGEYG